MKKAEIIKNGNVNLKPIKTKIDWRIILKEYREFILLVQRVELSNPSPINCFDWFQERIEKELNQ